MKNLTLEALIALAIKNEEEAYESYMELYGLVEDKDAKDTLKFMAQEEKQHKAYLVKYRDGGFRGSALPMNAPVDYKIAEQEEKPEIRKDVRTREVYLIAANKELNAAQFYQDLAKMHPDGDVKDLLLGMAQQELRHKEKVEYLYTNTAFTQTAGG
jgi:rubrerythrin